ncbi:MAG: DegV family protein [Dehalococcoidia bacterium]|nr:MAG: DegV family protein [Dehalococcoidia bacterium]
MKKIGIVTEETADLPLEMMKKLQISVVPVKLTWPELESLPGSNTFQKMRELEVKGIESFGKTSQPSPHDFLIKFKEQLTKFHNILCISLTSKLSGSYNSALIAKSMLSPEEQKKIFLFDSLSGSGGQALFILKAKRLMKKDKSIHDIFEELKQSVSKVHLYIMFKDSKWMAASGRVSPVITRVVQGMAKIGIRPVLTIKNGEFVMSGLRARAKDLSTTLYKQVAKDTEQVRQLGKRIQIAITHGDDIESAKRLRELIEKELENVEVAFTNIINNVVGAPAGPGTLAVAWHAIDD